MNRCRTSAAVLLLVSGTIAPLLWAQPAQQAAPTHAANAAVQQAVTQQPPRRTLTTRDALQMYRDGKYQDAVDETLAEIQATPGNLDSYVVLGWSLLALGRYQDAVNWATKALGLAPQDERVIEILGEANYRLGNDQDALKYFQQYVRISGGVPDRLIHYVYYFMGEIYLRMNDLNKADIALSTALHFQPDNLVYWVRLGYVREKERDYAGALSAYTHALALNPSYQEAIAGKARVEPLVGG